MRLVVFNNLKNPAYLMIALGVAFLFFDVSYYVMKTFPGYRDLMCVDAGNFTTENLVFSAIFSLLIGILIVGFIETFKMRKATLSTGSVSGVGMIVGSLTVFCPLCTFPIISVVGLGTFFTFMSVNDVWFKLLSLVLLIWSLWMVNKQLSGECRMCK